MGYLSRNDVVTLTNCVATLYGSTPTRNILDHMVVAVARAIPTDYVGITSAEFEKRESLFSLYPFGSIANEEMLTIARTVHQHPFYCHRGFQPPSAPGSRALAGHTLVRKSFFQDFFGGRAMRATEALPMRKLLQLEIFGSALKQIGGQYSMGVNLQHERVRTKVLAFSRGRRDYSERERIMLDVLRPHLVQYLALAGKNFPRSSGPGMEIPLTGSRLTPREAEVLHWVAQGKTNDEIAIILGMATRTVKKHLERIFQKLGVENRTSAALMAMEANTAGK